MKRLIKDSKKGGFRGYCARKDLKMALGAVGFMLILGAVFICTGTIGGTAVGIALATVPLAGFVMPDGDYSDNEKKGMEALAKHLTNQFDEVVKGHMTSEEYATYVSEAIKKSGIDPDAIKKMNDILKEQGVAIEALREPTRSSKNKPWNEQLKEFMKSEDFKKGIADGKTMSFEVKAAPTTITAGNFTNAQPFALSHEVEPGIGVAPSEPNIIFRLLSKGTTNSRDIYWVNRGPINGEASFLGEGQLKPLLDWEYTKETSNAKKVADATKVSTEMLEDFDYMESEIREVVREMLLNKVDQELLNGNGTGDNLKGILTGASAYVGTALDGSIPGANVVDVIRAIVLQMRLLNQRPDVVLLNPTDKAAVDLLKNETNNYISAEAKAVISNLTIIETNEIEPGKVVVIDTSKFKVRVYKGIRIEFGWEDKDFRNNLVTVICEMRLHSYHNSIDDSAIVYDDIATVAAALEKVTELAA